MYLTLSMLLTQAAEHERLLSDAMGECMGRRETTHHADLELSLRADHAQGLRRLGLLA